MRFTILAAAVLLVVATCNAKIFYKETFPSEESLSKWVVSSWKQDANMAGKWTWSTGRYFADKVDSNGLHTTQDNKFYAISTVFDETVKDTSSHDLVVQFQLRHPQSIDCGGGYIKLLPREGLNQKDFSGEHPYLVMFGPDICGSSNRKVHVIVAGPDGKNHELNQVIPPGMPSELSHVYRLVLKPDNSYQVLVDGSVRREGNLIDDVKDIPMVAKDPSVPKELPDPDSQKPSDWDDEVDGEWQAAMVPNPDYEEVRDPSFGNMHLSDIGGLGIEIWQVKSGSVFDNIIVTDSIEEADKFTEETFSEEMRETERLEYDAKEPERLEMEKLKKKQVEETLKAQGVMMEGSSFEDFDMDAAADALGDDDESIDLDDDDDDDDISHDEL